MVLKPNTLQNVRKLALLICALSSFAWGQGAVFNGQVLNASGQAIAGASIAVTNVNPCNPTSLCSNGSAGGTYTGSLPPGSLITLYSDFTLTTTVTNPLTSDGFGNYQVFGTPGSNLYAVIYGQTTLAYVLPFSLSGTLSGSFNSIAPSTAKGGLIVGTGTNTYGNVAIGATGTCLSPSGGTAAWLNCFIGNTTLLVQTNQSNTFSTGTQDLSASSHTLPAKVGTVAAIPATCTVGELYFASDATAGQNIYECGATNTWTQQLNTGGASGMSTSMSNAAAVAYPVALTPANSVIGTASSNVGSTTNPVNNVIIGTANGTSVALAKASGAGNFTATFPAATDTVAELGQSQTYTGTVTFNAVSKIKSASGTAPSSYFMNLATGDAIRIENAGASGSWNLISKNSNDITLLGDIDGAMLTGPLELTNSNGAVGTSFYSNDATNPLVATNTACASSTGTARQCQFGDTSALGIVALDNASNPVIEKLGPASCVFDNTPTLGDKVTLSTINVGQCHDAGLTPSTSSIGTVMSSLSPPLYLVDVALGGSAAASGVSLAPALSQKITSASSTAVPLQVQCNSASSVNCFEVYQANGTLSFKIDQNGVATFGTGIGNVTAGHFISASSNPASGAASNIIQLATSDLLAYRNNGNTGDVTLGLDTSNNLKLSGGTGFKVLGPSWTNATLLSFTNPGQAQTLTVPDVGSTADTFAFTSATQTLANKVINPYLDFTAVAAPVNPAGGCRMYYDSTSVTITGLRSDGTNCIAASGTAGALSGISAAVASNTINNSANAQRWNWQFTAGGGPGFRLSENAASTSGGSIFQVDTAAASTAVPMQVTAGGTANGLQVGTDAVVKLIGSSGMSLGTSPLLKSCTNEGVTGTTNKLLAKYTTASPITCIKSAITDTQGNFGVVFSGGATTGTALIAVEGAVTATFDGTTVIGDYAVPSVTTAGQLHDAGSNLTQGLQPLGRILTVNAGVGTDATVNLFGQNYPSVTTDGTVTLTYTGSQVSIALPQALSQASNPQFGSVAITSGGTVGGPSNSASLTYYCAKNSTSSVTGSCIYKNGDMTSASSTANNAGAVTFRGGNSAATGSTSAAGDAHFQAGQATGGAGNHGGIFIEGSYSIGTVAAQGDVVYISSNNTVTDCVTTCTNFIGVATSQNGSAQLVALEGSHITVQFDGTYSPSAGWFACTSPTTPGKILPQSSACSAGRRVGIIEASGSSVTSGKITIRPQ